ncbi:MAG: formate/nitrite transporter family protein [Sedimentisphaerales bacterium]|nr:formate/nitrite transporter family protein [Sedimentisphaerales bacterium]
MSNGDFSVDALLPPAMAEKAENVGVAKANMDALTMFLLAILAGSFIGLGAEFCTVTITGTKAVMGFGLTKLLGGLVFCIGLILVIVAGAELFTGNNLILMATISGKVSIVRLLRNWIIVYLGNFVGSVATAFFIYLSTQYTMDGGAVGQTAMNIAAGKCNPDVGFLAYFFRAIYCNALVCLAVWLCFSARTSTDKILCILFPITAFVASGFEHCVANMYFIPIGLFIKDGTQTVMDNLTWSNFFIVNLLPVTLGNIVGGAGFVGVFYWLIYRRKKP